MASIVRLALENEATWPDVAARATRWLAEYGVDLRSAIVLVPLAQHLPPARRAWALQGGWQPRIETTRTLALSLGPSPRVAEGQVTFDASTDRLIAAGLLRSQSWAAQSPLAFDEAVAAVVNTAHALLKAASAIHPDQRATHWLAGRALLSPVATVGTIERGLARVALEWASLAPPAVTDRLFSLRPAAWVVVQGGGEDRLIQQLLQATSATVPALVLDTDAAAERSLSSHVSMAQCEGFEQEAQCSAAQVLHHLQRQETPVALVAQDRLLVRRVRALLERQGVNVQDETGWTLSTTRAAAQIMAMLRAASPTASTDLLLDALKAGGSPHASGAVAELEALCRREAWSQVMSVRPERLRGPTAAFFTEVQSTLQTFQSPRRQSLSRWLATTASALERTGIRTVLAADAAGEQVLRALHLLEPAAWAGQQAAQTSMSLPEFTAWVDAALEDASFVLQAAPDADVIITPLTRVMLRPFAAIVFPGADDHHLGAAVPPHPLLSDSQAQALGVPTAGEQRASEALAFAHAVSRLPVSLFHRHADGDEPMGPSALLERLELRLQAAGLTPRPWVDPRLEQPVEHAPIGMPAPSAAVLLPERLSASACEALRACPYRFFALYLLRLREADELEAEIEPRDYGNWLHAVLMTFHETRAEPAAAEVECARLLQIAKAEQEAQGLGDASFLPFEAAFAELAPRYIGWLHQRDAEGARWSLGELDREVIPAAWHGIRMHGRIDRIDTVRAPGGGEALELIDYKTGSPTALRDKLRQPYEDTQLAFYAALVQLGAGQPLHASYLALGRKIESLPHPEVADSAQALVEGVGAELARLRRGAVMPALGEPPVCDYCEARGLCRKDHWSTQ